MSNEQVIRIERHTYHHHSGPRAEMVHVQKNSHESCDRAHIGPVTTGLAVLGGFVLLGLFLGSRE